MKNLAQSKMIKPNERLRKTGTSELFPHPKVAENVTAGWTEETVESGGSVKTDKTEWLEQTSWLG